MRWVQIKMIHMEQHIQQLVEIWVYLEQIRLLNLKFQQMALVRTIKVCLNR